MACTNGWLIKRWRNMMAYFSPSTSRRLVNNQLQRESEDMQTRHSVAWQIDTSTLPQNLGFRRNFYEQNLKTTFGDSLLGFNWVGRKLSGIALVSYTPDKNQNTPHRTAVVVYEINIRSNVNTHHVMLILTTHVMERLLERCKTVHLLSVIKEEFDLSVIDKIICHAYDGVPSIQNMKPSGTEFKIETITGWACGVIEAGIPTVKTWYPR